MNRRTFLGTAAAGATVLAAPRLARGTAASTLKFVPAQDLALLDPIQSPSGSTIMHSCLVFDTLYGLDESYKAQPQMVEGHLLEDDGKIWKLTLREGLKFHNGEPVRARDVVASLQRWGKRDTFGQTLFSVTNELSAPSDKVVQFRLTKPFPMIPDALGKIGAFFAIIVPEHLAQTEPTKGMPEIIGSGPYRYVASERVQGSLNVYARFTDYVPRNSGTPSFLAGPKITHFDRVEWHTIPDPATATAALQAGEVDWWDQATADMLPLLRKNANIMVSVRSTVASFGMLRPNQTQPPFNNPAIRRAVLGGINQSDYMIAVAGEDRSLWRADCGFFTPGSPMATSVGMEALNGPRDFAKVKRQVEAAGYNGERLVYLAPTDLPALNAISEVAADMFRKIGMNLDYVATDWGTVAQRFASREPLEKGGWSMYPNYVYSVSMISPAANNYIRGSGPKAMFGWPDSPQLENLRWQWLETSDLREQRRICQEIQMQAFEDVPYYPLGVYYPATAYRRSLTGVLDGYSLFYNVRRA
jgi:peptide/nickel transport system substrate-binding protein